jgi:hypothetical protein
MPARGLLSYRYLLFMNKGRKPRKLKTFLVALDRPGAGWSDTVRAYTLEGARKSAKRKFRELPDTISEVSNDYEELQAEARKQEPYDRLDSGAFLVALKIAGALPSASTGFWNEQMMRALNNHVDLLMGDESGADRVRDLLERE